MSFSLPITQSIHLTTSINFLVVFHQGIVTIRTTPVKSTAQRDAVNRSSVHPHLPSLPLHRETTLSPPALSSQTHRTHNDVITIQAQLPHALITGGADWDRIIIGVYSCVITCEHSTHGPQVVGWDEML